MTALLWFRRDLRLSDHPALVAAADQGLVLPVYVLDPAHEPAGEAPRRRRDAALAALRAATDGALVVRTGDSATVVAELASEVNAGSVHVTADAEAFPGVVAPGGAADGSGPGSGEDAAWARWEEFLDSDLSGYADQRDRPDLDATSRMSAHLTWGEVHPRSLLASLAGHPAATGDGSRRFVDELCWREFCADVLLHHPDSAWSDLRPELAGLEHDPVGPEVEAWRQGRTGFPFVDAGMRQLAEVGWMHNRVRMVTASFLVKDLQAPWQVGARHFLDLLVDADLASNAQNWQWVAGTGTDAAPYFRIVNPVRQGLRFDPDGAYVRRWVPELGHLPGAAAHEPGRHVATGGARGYPGRILDHDEERREALERFRQTSFRGTANPRDVAAPTTARPPRAPR